jgi:hypothetical protein
MYIAGPSIPLKMEQNLSSVEVPCRYSNCKGTALMIQGSNKQWRIYCPYCFLGDVYRNGKIGYRNLDLGKVLGQWYEPSTHLSLVIAYDEKGIDHEGCQ